MGHFQVMRYYKQFIWLKIENNSAIIGITDFALAKWGEILYVELPFLGKFCKEGDQFGLIQTAGSINYLAMPVDGLVLKINTKLKIEPGLINIDPMGEGWLIQIQIVNPEQMESLMPEKVYQQIISS